MGIRTFFSLALLLKVCQLIAIVGALQPIPQNGHWVDAWTSMPQLTETSNLPPTPFTQPNVVFNNATLRQTVHLSTSTKQLRIRISNAFGTTDLPITAAAIALPLNGTPGSNAIVPGSVQNLTFSGNSSIIVPNGALVVSDPIELKTALPADSMLTIDLFLATGQTTNNITSHPGSRTTSFFANGKHVGAQTVTGSSAEHWYFLSAVEAWTSPSIRSLSIVGDSITDGRGSTTNGNDRWPDQLLNRTLANRATASISIVNQAAGGNRILLDGLGPNALGRIERDVLSHPNVGFVMIFEGTNDIGTGIPNVADRLIQAFQQIITRVHTEGLPIFGATITPFFGNAYFTTVNEAARQKVNDWIRKSGKFDGVVDFDLAARDPNQPNRLNPSFDSGDGLHLNPQGYKVMADAVDLNLFTRFAKGVNGFQ
ncbi:SGNH hydrolase [Panus rudis PR-1116 ss-1]|nr:SGNH hydrolase [Panus rudis PR-1116 ss-1]